MERQAFTDAKVNDPEIQTLMRKISAVLDEGQAGLGATVEVETTEGRIHTGSSDIFQEVVELGLKMEKIQTKFEDLCLPVMGKRRMEQVRGAILSLERLEDLNLLFG